MRILNKSTGLPSVWALLLIAVLAACGSDTDGKTVAVNLSLIVDGRQAQHQPAVSRLFAWIERWFPGATPAWAQTVSDIATIQVQISGPGIAVAGHSHRPGVRSNQRARDSCEHPSAGRAQPDNHGDSFQCSIAPSENIWRNAARRKLDRGSACQSRGHAGKALYGHRAEGGEWQRHRQLLARRHRLRRHVLRAVSTGCDRVFERRSGAGICVRRLERRLLRHRSLFGHQQCHSHRALRRHRCYQPIKCGQGRKRFRDGDEQSERNLVWCGLLVSVPHRQLCRARSSSR